MRQISVDPLGKYFLNIVIVSRYLSSLGILVSLLFTINGDAAEWQCIYVDLISSREMVEENLAMEGDKIMKEKRFKDATFLVSKMKEGVKSREILTALLSLNI